MKHLVSTYADATETVNVESREDLATMFVRISDETVLLVKGTQAERIAFLHNLITAGEHELANMLVGVSI